MLLMSRLRYLEKVSKIHLRLRLDSPNGILHGYGEWSALLEEGDVGFDKVVNVSVQLRSRGQGRQEVLKNFSRVYDT